MKTEKLIKEANKATPGNTAWRNPAWDLASSSLRERGFTWGQAYIWLTDRGIRQYTEEYPPNAKQS